MCPYKCLELDRNNDSDVYSVLQTKKQLKGVPSLLAYSKGNFTFMANLSISGIIFSILSYSSIFVKNF